MSRAYGSFLLGHLGGGRLGLLGVRVLRVVAVAVVGVGLQNQRLAINIKLGNRRIALKYLR